MTELEERALARLPLDPSQVLRLYDQYRTIAADLSALCESHERLRMELTGAEVLIREERVRALIEGVTRFAWWKGGVEYVGTCGKTLADAIAEVREEEAKRG